jgi:hypothetical protein
MAPFIFRDKGIRIKIGRTRLKVLEDIENDLREIKGDGDRSQIIERAYVVNAAKVIRAPYSQTVNT